MLNDSPLVSANTRIRVRRAIAELGFRPSSTARKLALGRTQVIGVVAPFFTTASVIERLRGVVECLRERGEYDLLLFDVEAPSQRADALRSFGRTERVDGLLVMSLHLADDEVESLRRAGLAVALVDIGHSALPSVTIDDVLGGEMATRHLVSRGHTRIGFVGDEPSPFGFTSSERRRQGLIRELRRSGLESERALQQLGPHGREAARGLAERLLRLENRPTAIFAASDTQAMGVLQAARAMRLRVPRDLAVIGFDDIEIAELLGLTTIRQPLRYTGTRGAELLLSAIDGADSELKQEVVPLTVVERSTT